MASDAAVLDHMGMRQRVAVKVVYGVDSVFFGPIDAGHRTKKIETQRILVTKELHDLQKSGRRRGRQ